VPKNTDLFCNTDYIYIVNDKDRIIRAYVVTPIGSIKLYKVVKYHDMWSSGIDFERTYIRGNIVTREMYSKTVKVCLNTNSNSGKMCVHWHEWDGMEFKRWKLYERYPYSIIKTGNDELTEEDKFELNLQYGSSKYPTLKMDDEVREKTNLMFPLDFYDNDLERMKEINHDFNMRFLV